MKLIESDMLALSTAKDWFLGRYGLTEADVTAALGEIFQHRVDYADLYFQYARSESWSLEEGHVKSGSFDIEEGVGVRAVTGDKQAFSYSDDISSAALLGAARADTRHRPQRQPYGARRALDREATRRPRGPRCPLCADGSAGDDRSGAEDRAARTARTSGPGARSAHHARDGEPRGHLRDRDGRGVIALRVRRARSRHPSARAAVADGDRRAGRDVASRASPAAADASVMRSSTTRISSSTRRRRSTRRSSTSTRDPRRPAR